MGACLARLRLVEVKSDLHPTTVGANSFAKRPGTQSRSPGFSPGLCSSHSTSRCKGRGFGHFDDQRAVGRGVAQQFLQVRVVAGLLRLAAEAAGDGDEVRRVDVHAQRVMSRRSM